MSRFIYSFSRRVAKSRKYTKASTYSIRARLPTVARRVALGCGNTALQLGIIPSLAAKFITELASDAGKGATLIVFKPSDEAIICNQLQVEWLRQVWGVEGKSRLPIKVSEIISEICRDLEELIDQSLREMELHQWRNQ